MPLETAEQFLLTLGSISNLEARLKLWAFKLDFKVDLLNPQTNSDFNLSGDGKRHMWTIQSSQGWAEGSESQWGKIFNLFSNSFFFGFQTFRFLVSVTLAMGNILNRSKTTAFRIELLEKLSGVRDTVSRKSLLHHVVSRCNWVNYYCPDLSLWLLSVEVPWVASRPWQLAARAEGPWLGCQDGLRGAADKPEQNGGAHVQGFPHYSHFYRWNASLRLDSYPSPIRTVMPHALL